MAESDTQSSEAAETCRECGCVLVGRGIDLCPACAMKAAFGFSPTKKEEPKDDLLAGRYRLGEMIGEGGFGEVYRADQIEPLRRQVAIKIIKPGMDRKDVVARFELERQALAQLDHAGIAKIYDAGETGDGRPFFAMELAEGEAITFYCQKNEVSLPGRLALFIEVCDAIQHAHQRGIIHRDLKPSNILVAEGDEGPRLKVIDFGIAKATSRMLTEDTLITEMHQFVGTPAYVSPEQAEMSGLDVDTRSDIYSLGALLYELLTGTPPFEADELKKAGFGEILRIIREEQPPKPSTRITVKSKARDHQHEVSPPRVSGDLDWVVMRALEKEPDRRYATAHSFAKDIQRFLDDDPVEARPPGRMYLMQKFVRRHRAGVAAALVAALGLVMGLVFATAGFVKARQEAEEARLQAERANTVIGFIDEMFASADPALMRGGDYTVRELLDEYSREFEGKLAEQPEVALSLQRTIGSAYLGLGEYSSAARHFSDALSLSESLSGEGSAEAVEIRRQLGWALRHLGHYHQAKEELERCLAEGKDGEAMQTKVLLLEVYRLLGNHEEALDLAKELRGKAEHSQRNLNILALAFAGAGDFEMARLLGEHAVALVIRQHGEKHPHLIRAYDTLATITASEGLTEEALVFAKLGHEIARETLEDDHPARLFAESRMQELRLEEDPGQDTEKMQSLAVKLLEEMGDSPEVFRSTVVTAATLFAQGKPDEAKKFLAHSLGVDERMLRAGNRITDDMTGPVVRKIMEEGRVRDYLPMMEQACVLARGLFGKEGHHTNDLRRVLFYMYRWAGRYDDAETTGRIALNFCRKHYGESSQATVNCMVHLAEIFWDRGKEKEAAELFSGDFQGTRNLRETAALQEEIARYFERHGQVVEASKYAQEAVENRRQVFGSEHPATVRALALVGEIERSYALSRGKLIFPLMIDELKLARAVHGDGAMETARAIDRLARGSCRAIGLKNAVKLLEESIEKATEAGATSNVLSLLRKRHATCVEMLKSEGSSARRFFQMYEKMDREGKGSEKSALQYLVRSAFRCGLIGDHAAARERIELALKKGKDGKVTEAHQLWARGVSGWLYWMADDDKKAKEYFGRLLRETLENESWEPYNFSEMLGFFAGVSWDKGGLDEYWEVMDQVEDANRELLWDRDRTEVIVPRESRWCYHHESEAPYFGWRGNDYQADILWERGTTPLSSSRELAARTFFARKRKGNANSWVVRKEFHLEKAEEFTRFKARLSVLGGARIFVNGKEAASYNLPAEVDRDTLATERVFGRPLRVVPLEIDARYFRSGGNVIVVEAHRDRVDREVYFEFQLEGLR